MAVYSIVRITQLENFGDYSAEYYRPEYLQLSRKVRRWPTRRVKNEAYVTDGEHGSPDYDVNSGIRYIAADFIRPNFIEDAPMRFISAGQDARNARCRVRPGDILIYSVGAYAGFAARAEPHLFPASIPRSVAIIRMHESSIFKTGFVTIFLNTSYGIFQSHRLRAGNSQPVLALEKIRQIEIPVLPEPFQAEIDSMYDNAYKNRLRSKKLYEKAQHLIESELRLGKLRFPKSLGYTARLSDLEQSRRLDAQHYQPRFAQLFDHLAAFPLRSVNEIRTYNRRGVQPVYVENGTMDVVNSQHLGPKHVDYDGLEKTSEIAFSLSSEGQILQNDLLIYTTGAYIGRTNAYLRNAPALASNHVNILRLSPGIDAAYMALIFQSVIGQSQTQKHARGSAQAELYPADVDRFVVPLLKPAKQLAIGDLVRESLANQQESTRLLEKAKTRVEQFIEEAVRS